MGLLASHEVQDERVMSPRLMEPARHRKFHALLLVSINTSPALYYSLTADICGAPLILSSYKFHWSELLLHLLPPLLLRLRNPDA